MFNTLANAVQSNNDMRVVVDFCKFVYVQHH